MPREGVQRNRSRLPQLVRLRHASWSSPGVHPRGAHSWQFWFKVAVRCFHSSSLQHRLFGLDQMAVLAIKKLVGGGHRRSVCAKPRSCRLASVQQGSRKLWLTGPILTKWLQEGNVLGHVFGDRIHAEMVKRFQPLLRFLISSRALRPVDVEAVRRAVCVLGTVRCSQAAARLGLNSCPRCGVRCQEHMRPWCEACRTCWFTSVKWLRVPPSYVAARYCTVVRVRGT